MPADPSRAKSIFLAALAVDAPGERGAYVTEACSGDPDLRRRVDELLRANDAPGRFLDAPAVAEFPGPAEVGTGTRTGPSGPDGHDGLDFLEPSDKPGSLGRLGHYDVQELVGRGGMGVVLRAFDERLHRAVAIKVMAPQLATSATARRRFTREARAAAAVTHDHVVTIHAVEESGPLPYIVMQFVAGASLQDRLDRTGPLTLPEVLRIGTQAAAALAAAHAQGLVHRDVKPANILLENGVERVKITDFGLARTADDATLTQAGAVAGTPQYMSPEQAEGRPVDARSDLFSLGGVLYAMCTGRPPFQGSTARSVLRRVVEDAPPPVREANPEVPDWLAAVVDKLQAKDPAARFQSAAEVGDVLGRHLAHVQHPSVVPLPAAVKSADGPPAPVRRAHAGRRWAVVAAVLVAALAVLGTTEAAGVTSVRATVIRILTPEGTLVVETDDPAVKVTVEGDGDLVITGTGAQEVRLKAGGYRLKATRDGRPVALDRDLVTIARGDRQIVRVRLENEPPAAVAPTAGGGAFVLLGGPGVAERTFDTLDAAVLAASAGDTVEVRGNGPFVSDGVTTRHPLVIRAGAGYAPSISLSKASAAGNIHLVTALDGLVLEGLELRRLGGAAGRVEDRYPVLLAVAAHPGSFHVANCRLTFKADPPYGDKGALFWSESRSLSVRNSVLCGNLESEAAWRCESGGRYDIENCVSATGGVGFSPRDRDVRDVSVRLRGNTLVGNCLNLTLFTKPTLPPAGPAVPPIRLELSGNLARWDATVRNKAFLFFHQAHGKEPYPAAEAEALLPRLVTLDEKRNVYQTGRPMLDVVVDWNSLRGKRGRDLADWDRLWGQKDTGSVEGDIRFHGGDLVTRARSAPEQLTAEDFRLRPDSAGYRAGPGGKDDGADVDLVGPGPSYERWKKTPGYQRWLSETGQVKK